MNITIQVVSVPDRDNLVAELWLGDVQVAEVSSELGHFEVEVYAHRLTIPLEEYVDALSRARKALLT